MSHQYDPEAPVKLSYRLTHTGDKITVHLFVTLDTLEEWSNDFLIQKGYKQENHRNLNPELFELEVTDGLWLGSISFVTQESEDLLIIRYQSDFDFYFDIL